MDRPNAVSFNGFYFLSFDYESHEEIIFFTLYLVAVATPFSTVFYARAEGDSSVRRVTVSGRGLKCNAINHDAELCASSRYKDQNCQYISSNYNGVLTQRCITTT